MDINYDGKLAEWRGQIINAVENLDKNDDTLFRKVDSLTKRVNEYCIKAEGRLSTMENDIKNLKDISNKNIKYRRWIWGMIISVIGEMIAFIALIAHLGLL